MNTRIKEGKTIPLKPLGKGYTTSIFMGIFGGLLGGMTLLLKGTTLLSFTLGIGLLGLGLFFSFYLWNRLVDRPLILGGDYISFNGTKIIGYEVENITTKNKGKDAHPYLIIITSFQHFKIDLSLYAINDFDAFINEIESILGKKVS